jgi:aminopeptidase N
VESPHLGMEHQSAIAYGNNYVNGYRGTDLSGTGHGMEWDYIIIHESGHEWFGNSITTADIADMWVHEGFTDYAETIYTQCLFGDAAGDDYVVGLRKKIANVKPIIGPYGVNQEGSGDMYYKGANMLHTIRHVIGDSAFKAMLLEMNKRYYHKVVTSAEVEHFISGFSHRDLRKVFDQYLRTTQIPTLEWTMRKGDLFVRWANCVEGFAMPVNIIVNGEERMIQACTQWTWPASGMKKVQVAVDRNWYVNSTNAGKHAITKQEVRDLRLKNKGCDPPAHP